MKNPSSVKESSPKNHNLSKGSGKKGIIPSLYKASFLMKASIWVFLCIVVLLIVGSIVMVVNEGENFFANPYFILLLAVFALLTILCSCRHGFSVKKIGFHLCHFGIVAILIGGCIGTFKTVKTNFAVPVDPNMFYSQLQLDDESVAELGFNFGLIDFEVEKYDPDYGLYKFVGQDRNNPQNEDFVFVKEVKQHIDGTYDAGRYGRIPFAQLRDATSPDGWAEHYLVNDDMVLFKSYAADKQYVAKMRISSDTGEKIDKEVRVNHPLDYNGWRFYLVSYDTNQGTYVSFSARRDPGRLFVIYGIWANMIGTAFICFKRSKKKGVNSL